MKIAFIYEHNQILVQFSDEKFRELLRKYFTGDMDEALDKLESDLKKEVLKI
jgi:hypothetical protein